MDVMLQRHCARYIYVVPDGLKELMSDISREVLRSQPTEMYTFIADYLDALLITRENARVAAKLVESITETATTTAELLTRTGMIREEVDSAVQIIQNAFRKHLSVKLAAKPNEQVEEANVINEILDAVMVSAEQAEEAAVIIQTAYRNFKQKREREKDLLRGAVDWRAAARSAILLYRKTGVTNEEANRAATLIKAAYKGYYTRRLMKRLVEEGQEMYAEEAGENDSENDEAEEFWEEDEDDEQKDKKQVKINFDTVIPHVDFDDPKIIAVIPDEQETESKAIATDIVDSIFDAVVGPDLEQSETDKSSVDETEKKEVVDPEQIESTKSEDQDKTIEDKPSTNLGQGDTDENLPEQNLDEQAPTPTETTGNETERTEYTTETSEITEMTETTEVTSTPQETTEEG